MIRATGGRDNSIHASRSIRTGGIWRVEGARGDPRGFALAGDTVGARSA